MNPPKGSKIVVLLCFLFVFLFFFSRFRSIWSFVCPMDDQDFCFDLDVFCPLFLFFFFFFFFFFLFVFLKLLDSCLVAAREIEVISRLVWRLSVPFIFWFFFKKKKKTKTLYPLKKPNFRSFWIGCFASVDSERLCAEHVFAISCLRCGSSCVCARPVACVDDSRIRCAFSGLSGVHAVFVAVRSVLRTLLLLFAESHFETRA